MINPDDYFYCLRNFPDLENEYVNQGLSATFTLKQPAPVIFAAKANIENSYIYKILLSHTKIMEMNWLMFPAKSNYNWHTDRFGRNCAVNIPIRVPDDAKTFCREPMFHGAKEPFIWYNVEQVEYIINKPTILNVKREHCVINSSNQDRIILSISFDESYEIILDYMTS